MSRIRAKYQQITAGYLAEAARLEELSKQRQHELEQRRAETAKAVAEVRDARAAKRKEQAEANADAKPDNPWAQPTRLPDSAARIGRFDDEDPEPPPAPEAPPAPPAPAIPTPPPPVAKEEPDPPRGRHALADDDDFESGSFLRG